MSHFTLPKVIDQPLALALATEQTAVQSVGSGLNDITAGGTTTGVNQVFTIAIDAEGTPDTFTWNVNGGAETAGVSITGAAQTLSSGLTVTFNATTGHTLADSWIVHVCGQRFTTTADNFDFKSILVKKIHIMNIVASKAETFSLARASDGLNIGAKEKTVLAHDSITLDFSPEGMFFQDGVLLSASAASSLTGYLIATQEL